MLVNNSFAVGAALLMSLGETANSFEMLIIGRFIIGVDSGRCFIHYAGDVTAVMLECLFHSATHSCVMSYRQWEGRQKNGENLTTSAQLPLQHP